LLPVLTGLLSALVVYQQIETVSWILVTYPDGFEEYASAISKICDLALSEYAHVFGMVKPQLPIHVFIYANASASGQKAPTLGTTVANYSIYLYVDSVEDLEPPTVPSHAHHVYGFIHEIGHIMFFTDNLMFSEGWADYAAAYRILPEVYSILGNSAWPIPYNYSQTEGRERILTEINNSSLTNPRTAFAAAKVLYTIDQKYGPLIFKKAMANAIVNATYYGSSHYPVYRLKDYENALVRLTNDTSLSQLFEENGF
jgi:hypothetical protein